MSELSKLIYYVQDSNTFRIIEYLFINPIAIILLILFLLLIIFSICKNIVKKIIDKIGETFLKF